jgi:hypothetical protein
MKTNRQTNEEQKILNSANLDTLKESATKLMSRFDKGASFAFGLVLNELENRMGEQEYVAFCETL